MYNKEQFRKELEDCWKAGCNAMLYDLGHTATNHPDRNTYIKSRLAALDDGDGLPQSYFTNPPNKHEKELIELYTRSQMYQIANNFYGSDSNMDKDTFDNYMNANGNKPYTYLKPLADGQEGKGLRWVKAEKGFPAFNGLFVCRIVKKGNGERSEKVSYIQHTNGHFFMPNDDGFKVTEWLDESAALPVADGEGEKVGWVWTDALVLELLEVNFGTTWEETMIQEFKESKTISK